jgi:hypothetical protein
MSVGKVSGSYNSPQANNNGSWVGFLGDMSNRESSFKSSGVNNTLNIVNNPSYKNSNVANSTKSYLTPTSNNADGLSQEVNNGIKFKGGLNNYDKFFGLLSTIKSGVSATLKQLLQ